MTVQLTSMVDTTVADTLHTGMAVRVPSTETRNLLLTCLLARCPTVQQKRSYNREFARFGKI